MNGPSRNLDKANFSSKKKEKQCAAFGCSNTFYGQWFAYELSLLQVYARIFAKYLSFYTYLILCELWMRVTIVAKLVQIF